MSNVAFVIADDHAAVIANDDCDFRYRASRECVPVGVQVAARVVADRPASSTRGAMPLIPTRTF